jgi:hypothetical protein
MESIWKEVVVASLGYSASIYLEQMGKITENKPVLLVLNWASSKYKCRELPQHNLLNCVINAIKKTLIIIVKFRVFESNSKLLLRHSVK